MSSLPHLPALRLGRSYASLETSEVRDYRTGEVLAEVSQVNGGLVRRDLARIASARSVLKGLTVEELIDRSARAGELFLGGELPLGDRGHRQSPQDYVTTLSRTSGLPHVMVRRNMAKIHYALTHLRQVLNGLSRGLDLAILDRGFGEQFGTRLSFLPTGNALGLVMPSNSPAVNSLWIPAIALKTPVVIKPGRDEPWTPYRLIQAFVAAGIPAEAFGFYPTDHDGAATILNQCGRALIFGDRATTQQYAGNPGIQIHGPGWSKVLLGEDQVDHWQDHVGVLERSIADNGGRSCINASAILVPRHAAAIASALAERLGPVTPTRPEDDQARLAGFANPKMAAYIDSQIEEGLKTPGAEDVTARFRQGPRLVTFEGGTYVRPTIIRCDSMDHPLANREFLCPYASVVSVPQEEMIRRMGYTLACTAITRDPGFIGALEEYPEIERLNIGPVSTMEISWDQPHEGNLFEFLWKRRSIERAW